MKQILPIALAALLLVPCSASAVIRGEVVPESRYPWLVDMLSCGGTLIAPDRVLTAAHCVEPVETSAAITLTVGEDYPGGRQRTVRRHARHPGFDSLNSELMARYDLAVLELAEPVKGIEPLPVAESDPKAGAPATILGHGRRRFFGLDFEDTPARYRTRERPLVKGKQTIVSDAACKKYYATNRYKRDFFDAADMICSLDPLSKPSRAAGAPWTSVCMGDSGGPLVSGGKLVGVTSWSEWCGLRHDPAVFARVSKLRDFALGEPVWAPYSPDAATVREEGRRLECIAPAFEGVAEVTGALWAQIGADGQPRPFPKATGLTFEAPSSGTYTCAIRAHNEGGAARTRDATPVTI
jgi:trypsin